MSNKNNSSTELEQRINSLKDLNLKLDDTENLFSNLTKNENLDYEKIMDEISPEERATLNWNFSYSSYTLYYRNFIYFNLVYLKLQNIDPRDHEIKDEMDRVKDFWKKLEDAKNFHTAKNSTNLNIEATGRMIKNILSSNSVEKINNSIQKNNEDIKKDTKRKTKGTVPIPEAVHLNWDKNLK